MSFFPQPSIQNLRYAVHLRETLFLSVPVIIGQLGQVMMGVIDTKMIGALGPVPISAAALGHAMHILVIIVSFGVCFMMASLSAEAKAQQNESYLGSLFKQGIITAILLGMIITPVNYLSAELFYVMDQPVSDIEPAASYLRILSWSILPAIIFLMAKSFVDGLSLTRPAMYVTLVGLVLNVGANWILIYGKFGFPRLELDGAGYGTVFSRAAMALMMVGYILWHKKLKAYAQGGWRMQWQVVRRILKLGIPAGFQYLFEVGAFAGAAFLIGYLGSLPRAAHQIVITIASVTFMVALGISSGASIRVGDAFGRKNRREMRRAGYAGIILVAGFMSMMAILFVFLREALPSLFLVLEPGASPQQIPDQQVVLGMASQLMLLAAFFQLFDGVQAVGLGILRGIQDTFVPTLVTFIVYWVIALPLASLFAFVFHWGVNGVWIALVLSLVLASVMHTIRFSAKTRVKLLEEEVSSIPKTNIGKSKTAV
jgi:MATE family multidrug resistance protein